ncbi:MULTISPECIES: DJ-1/PfpI family protein [unclassified Nocardiopsis]|uniref:DJ-1/PfpI family protein n=1 Tax=unclassified Nocardiopsis TaxID=2649073 RepID=UPI00135A76B9|nr:MULTISPECIES: DJ-1/PfpI family protein [unclassified Nocardiopsis]
MHVQIVLFDGFDPLDAVGPFEVLAAGAQLTGGAVTVEFVSAEGPRRVGSGHAALSLDAASALDPERPGVVLVPGAAGPLAEEPGAERPSVPELLARAARGDLVPLVRRALGAPGVTVATVCGGSLVLAMAGLLTGRTAVTHTAGNDALSAAGVTVPSARVVDDGDLVSAGGVTSGIDLALHLLDREVGPRAALGVEGLFEFERRGTVWRRTDARGGSVRA